MKTGSGGKNDGGRGAPAGRGGKFVHERSCVCSLPYI